LGMVRAMERNGVNVNFFKPIAQPKSREKGAERSTAIIRQASNIIPPEPFTQAYAENLISANQIDDLLEGIVARFNS
ncbi:AAA family ATPase, partial [Staphylococcus pasteuri_A]|nr:AAA family ATPase [Staphylococcus pasteuri_A]